VTVCATNALKAVCVEDEEMARIVEAEELEPLRSDLETKPRVHYKNLWRYTAAFIAGTVSAERDGIVDCVSGATVSLMRDGEQIAEQATDPFGDFKFDRLVPDGSAYEVRVSAPGLADQTIGLELNDTKNLGEIRLTAG
jgi:hypothetical protein